MPNGRPNALQTTRCKPRNGLARPLPMDPAACSLSRLEPELDANAPLPVLYRAAHLIATHKPAGLLVHRTVLDRHETRFAVQFVRERYLAIVRGHPAEEGGIDHARAREYDDAECRAQADIGAPQVAMTRYWRRAAVELPIPIDRYPASRYALMGRVAAGASRPAS